MVDDKMMSLIIAGGGVDELKAVAVEGGMITLNDSCIDLVKKGITTVEEVVRTTYQLET